MPGRCEPEDEYRKYRDRHDTPTHVDSRYAAGHATNSYMPQHHPQQSAGRTTHWCQPSGTGKQQRSHDQTIATSDRRRYDVSRRSGRDRSRSPDRRARNNGDQRLKSVAAAKAIQASQGPIPGLSDPFQEVDKYYQRILLEGNAFEKPEWQWRARHPASPTANAVNNYIAAIQNSRIGPSDIDGRRIRSMPQDQVENAVRNTGLVLAHLHAKQYESSFSGNDWCTTLEQRKTLIAPGVVFKARIADSLYDRTVAIDHPSRGSHGNGPTSDKVRWLIALKIVEGEVEVLVTTGFGDKQQPPRDSRKEWVRFAHEHDTSKPEGTEGLSCIRFSKNHLTKTTFFRKTRSRWISLTNTPIAWQGRIIGKDIVLAADLMSLPTTHPFRIAGERQVREEYIRKRRE